MSNINDDKIKELEIKANEIRQSIIEMLIEAKSGHTAGPLGMADIFTLLYFHVLRHDPENPSLEDRDRLILSNGHICPVLYATMAHAGYFPISELKTLRKFGSILQGHPHREWLPALETSSGPLGSGLSQAVGMAIADRMDDKSPEKYFYCLMSDGELECGQTWEAVMLAGKEKLHNLVAIIDRNGIQIDGFTKDVMPLDPLKEKFESFNWHAIDVNGHDFRALNEAIGEAQSVYGKPSVLIAHTIPGKGVPEFERDYRWHGNPPGKGPEDDIPKDKQGEVALNRLRTLGGKIRSEHE
ncbi:transketolase [Patescibacteria group bacterium]|nr:transketolase [Patescibacteria group bacterium]